MDDYWPPLALESWRDTYATLHRYLQIIGKLQLALTPRVNHFWNVALRPTARGLVTPPMALGDGTPATFDLDVDLVGHALHARTSRGETRVLALGPLPVADFHRELMTLLAALGVRARIWPHPVEIASEAIPFPEDRAHHAYDEAAVTRFFHALSSSAQVLEQFRARFVGKCSPVHFFWGSFDLAVTRFSGRRAAERPGADPITREAYSHECISAGFWPGDERFPLPAYYCYAAPSPAGLDGADVRPAGAAWHPGLGEFLLPYDVVRAATQPREPLLEFLQSTYEAAAALAGWDRAALERTPEPVAPAAPPPEPPGAAGPQPP